MSVGDIMAKGKNSKKNKTKKVKDAEVIESEVVKENVYSNKNNDKSKTVNKARKDLIYSNNDSTDEMSKLLKIVLVVTGIMIIFYGITTFVTKKVNAVKTAKLGKSTEKVTIQYDSIVIGSMLNMDGHYFVLIEKEDDDKSSEYDTLLKSIEANDEAPKVYTADLSSSFNKMYLDKENNFDSDLTKFKVKDTTLVEVENNKIKNTFDNYDSIKGKLDELK